MRLDQGATGLLTLLAAGAGFGKTTLLSDWVQHANRRVGWVSLDDGDNDPARFMAYLIRALQRVRQEVGHTAFAALEAAQTPLAELVLTGVVNELAEQDDYVVLILDDYHVVRDPQVHQLVQFLLDHAPARQRRFLVRRWRSTWRPIRSRPSRRLFPELPEIVSEQG
ncbi:MAG: AAA family ATPase [bacterium]|nr:AAA family ATPase [bacterium]